jgi:hypothetical protein
MITIAQQKLSHILKRLQQLYQSLSALLVQSRCFTTACQHNQSRITFCLLGHARILIRREDAETQGRLLCRIVEPVKGVT